MNFWSWFFGSKKIDTRTQLSDDEEWSVPEEWFADSDGKRIRKKRKKKLCCNSTASSSEESTVCCDVSEDVVSAVLPVVALMSEAENRTHESKNPDFIDPDLPQSTPEPISQDNSSLDCSHSDHSSSSSYDSSSSNYDCGSSSYDSSPSCGSSCGGGGGD
jgi:hypothetical protein